MKRPCPSCPTATRCRCARRVARAGRDIPGEPAHEFLERADLFERRIQLERIEICTDASDDVRVDGHAASHSVRYARLRFASAAEPRSAHAEPHSCSTMSQPATPPTQRAERAAQIEGAVTQRREDTKAHGVAKVELSRERIRPTSRRTSLRCTCQMRRACVRAISTGSPPPYAT